jgi:hypothetical protein
MSEYKKNSLTLTGAVSLGSGVMGFLKEKQEEMSRKLKKGKT